MVAPRFRSRSFRRIFVKTPGGNTVLRHERRKPGKAVCSECGLILAGVPREIPAKIKKLSKTERRPQRPYGGVLCSKCMRLLFIKKAKTMEVRNG